MKKILGLCLVVGLVGCGETNTGLDKEFLNTSYDQCSKYLSSSLKSPSSLKVDQVTLSTNMASSGNIYKVFGGYLFDKNKVKQMYIDEKTRFRELLVNIDYDADNSYGASLRGNYQCRFIYKLKNNQVTPDVSSIYMIENINDGESVGLGVDLPVPKLTGSNFFMDEKIKNIVGTQDSSFTGLDEKMYSDIESEYKYSKMNKEAEELKESWGSSSVDIELIDGAPVDRAPVDNDGE